MGFWQDPRFFLFMETANVAKIQNVYEVHLKFIRADKRLENWPSFGRNSGNCGSCGIVITHRVQSDATPVFSNIRLGRQPGHISRSGMKGDSLMLCDPFIDRFCTVTPAYF